MTIARYYDEDKNPPVRTYSGRDQAETLDYAFIGGVPLRDLTDEEFDALPKHLQANVDASPFYRKTKPPGRSAAKADKPPAPAPESAPIDEATPPTSP